MKTLEEVYNKYSTDVCGGDKGTLHSYIDVYQEYMQKTDDISLLEIGVQFGYSIKMWQEYFASPNIYGIDINTSLIIFPGLDKVFRGDATNLNDIPDQIIKKEFDYIIDDGSHRVEDQIKSFDLLYKNLKVGGVYFIEDIDGDFSLLRIMNHLRKKNISYIVKDLRKNKGRFDDILLIIKK